MRKSGRKVGFSNLEEELTTVTWLCALDKQMSRHGNSILFFLDCTKGEQRCHMVFLFWLEIPNLMDSVYIGRGICFIEGFYVLCTC